MLYLLWNQTLPHALALVTNRLKRSQVTGDCFVLRCHCGLDYLGGSAPVRLLVKRKEREMSWASDRAASPVK